MAPASAMTKRSGSRCVMSSVIATSSKFTLDDADDANDANLLLSHKKERRGL